MWGQVIVTSHSLLNPGIIPTRVGTSFLLFRVNFKSRDHPHACGDKHSQFRREDLFKGSSPRVWGQGTISCVRRHRTRIIPTRVGTSTFLWLIGQPVQDHPHACGDKLSAAFFRANFVGSSPRVWGQVSSVSPSSLTSGIIPTRVGTRWIESVNDDLPEDHPHACGDKYDKR